MRIIIICKYKYMHFSVQVFTILCGTSPFYLDLHQDGETARAKKNYAAWGDCGCLTISRTVSRQEPQDSVTLSFSFNSRTVVAPSAMALWMSLSVTALQTHTYIGRYYLMFLYLLTIIVQMRIIYK